VTNRILLVHSISIARGLFLGITSTLGGKQHAIEEIFYDVIRESLTELQKIAYNHGNNSNNIIIGLRLDISEFKDDFITCVATGTLLTPKTNKGGAKNNKTKIKSVKN